MSNFPLVSVILPVYNGEKFLIKSIKSILNQTYTNLELLIVNDGSTDRSEQYIFEFTDERIRYFKQENKGLASSLNFAIAQSQGDFIARQDADDFSDYTRIEKQVSFMLQHPKCFLLGTRAKIINENGEIVAYHNHPLSDIELRIDLLFDNPFVHSSVLFRNKLFDRYEWYVQDKSYFEDYKLWSEIAAMGEVNNLKEHLVDYTHHKQGISKTDYYKKNAVIKQSEENLNVIIPNKEASVSLSNLYHRNFEGLSHTQVEMTNHYFSDLIIQFNKYYRLSDSITRVHFSYYKKLFRNRILEYKRLKVTNRLLKFYYTLRLKLGNRNNHFTNAR